MIPKFMRYCKVLTVFLFLCKNEFINEMGYKISTPITCEKSCM
jgi:hypothetical protein